VLVAATQLSGCFPVVAGAMVGGVASATDRRPTPTQTVDRGLQLEADSTLASRYEGAARVNVSVFNRKVLLTGEARNDNVKQQIDQYVRGLPNARVVIDELEVTSSPSFATKTEDAYVTSKVKTMLMTADGVPSNSIKVTTEKGVVYLLGIVTTAEGDRATEVARNVGGVAKVVKAFDYVSDTERARLDAASTSQNANLGSSSDGMRAQSVEPSAQPAPVTEVAPAASTSPVSTPLASPNALPPGRNLP
jgi:osmotically-inducible protein OsmY